MAIDCTDDVALRTSICNINTDLEQMITNADGVLTTNYGAKPIKQLVREGINNDLQALGINYVWATATERAAQTGMVLDDQGYQIDTKEVYKYNGTSWIFYYSLGATEFSDNTFKIVDGARSATTGASFQFSADSIATGSNITITVPNIDLIMGDARRDLSIAHDITTDADYTLTATQNQYGRIEITDTGVVLTGAINIIMNNDEHTFLFVNSTTQTLTVKTGAGTGIAVLAGEAKELRNDTVNVIEYEVASTSPGVLQVVKMTTTNATISKASSTTAYTYATGSITTTKASSKIMVLSNIELEQNPGTSSPCSIGAEMFRKIGAGADVSIALNTRISYAGADNTLVKDSSVFNKLDEPAQSSGTLLTYTINTQAYVNSADYEVNPNSTTANTDLEHFLIEIGV